MGAPSQDQIDELIERGFRQRWSEDRILAHLLTLERETDAEMAAVGVWPGAFRDPPAPRPDFDAEGNIIASPAARESASTVSTSPREESNCHPTEGDSPNLAAPSISSTFGERKSYEVDEVDDPPVSFIEGDTDPTQSMLIFSS